MKTILCFAAHPDDLEFSCTATLWKYKQKGYEIIYVVLTNGENGGKIQGLSTQQRINVRKQEQLKSAEMLGVKQVIFLEYRDGFLQYTDKLRGQLVEIIRQYKPEIIFSFDPANRNFDNLNLYHRDHRVAAEAVFDACFAAKNRHMYRGEPHRMQEIYFYGSAQPDYFEDITRLIDLKLKILYQHKSQFSDWSRVKNFVKDEISKKTDKYKYSEAFRVLQVRQIL